MLIPFYTDINIVNLNNTIFQYSHHLHNQHTKEEKP